MVKQHTPRAAVYPEGDPRAANAARVVPIDAELLTVGNAILGYVVHKKGVAWSLDRQRLAEIESLILFRHAPAAAVDTDDGEAYAEQAARHVHDPKGFRGWCRRWTPLLDAETVEGLARDAEGKGPVRADTIARRLGVTRAERADLRLKTIGAIDFDVEARKVVRRDRQREWMAQQRRAQGRLRRAEYEQKAKSRERPWEALGISRATFYRRIKRPPEPP